MRRALVIVALVGALSVLALRLWPSSPPPAPPTRSSPPSQLVPLAGNWDVVDEATCAAPALRALMTHPGWKFAIAEREWDDVVDDNPDETLAEIVVDARSAIWTDRELRAQTLALEPQERTDLLAALSSPCTPIVDAEGRSGNGYSGYYLTLSYGDTVQENAAIELPSSTPASLAGIAVFDRVRARYVAARLPVTQVMTLTLAGARRVDTNVWSRYTVVLHSDGKVTGPDGTLAELGAQDRVDALDWALQLPPQAAGADVVRGTLELAGSKRPVAYALGLVLDDRSAWRSAWLEVLRTWWSITWR